METEKPPAQNSDVWDEGLDWYFGVFESLCGLQSIGTSGAGENQLVPLTEEEKLDRKERLRNGFLLSMQDHPKPTVRGVIPAEADRAAFLAMTYGVFKRGRRIWAQLTSLPYSVQVVLRCAYESKALTEEQIRQAHLAYRGKPYAMPLVLKEEPLVPLLKWVNPKPCGLSHVWKENHLE